MIMAIVLATTAGSAPSRRSFSQEILDEHNAYRRAVGVTPLVWSNELARAAQRWADLLNKNLHFAHDPNNHSQGENLWMGTAGMFTLTEMVDSWGEDDEISTTACSRMSVRPGIGSTSVTILKSCGEIPRA